MLTPDAEQRLPYFKRVTGELWERIQGSLPGLQWIVTNRGSSVSLAVSTDSLYEMTIIRQLEHIVIDPASSRRDGKRRAVPGSKKPLEAREIALTDAEVDQIIETWRQGRSALTLPFVTCVWGRDGKPRTR